MGGCLAPPPPPQKRVGNGWVGLRKQLSGSACNQEKACDVCRDHPRGCSSWCSISALSKAGVEAVPLDKLWGPRHRIAAALQIRDHSWLTGKANIIRKVSKEVREANKKRQVARSQPMRRMSDANGPQNILIVEDVFLVRELMKKMFKCCLAIVPGEEDKFCIDCVTDGDEAIDAYTKKR